MVFIQYSEHSKGYVMYKEHPNGSMKEVDSKNGDFLEDEFLSIGEGRICILTVSPRMIIFFQSIEIVGVYPPSLLK